MDLISHFDIELYQNQKELINSLLLFWGNLDSCST